LRLFEKSLREGEVEFQSRNRLKKTTSPCYNGIKRLKYFSNSFSLISKNK